MMSPGRIFENRGAAATLLELSEQRRNRAKNPADVGAPAGLDLILPSQPCGVSGETLAVSLPGRPAPALHRSCSVAKFRTDCPKTLSGKFTGKSEVSDCSSFKVFIA